MIILSAHLHLFTNVDLIKTKKALEQSNFYVTAGGDQTITMTEE